MEKIKDLGLGSEGQLDYEEFLKRTKNLQLDNNGVNDTVGNSVGGDDPELEAILSKIREYDKLAERVEQLQDEVAKQLNIESSPGLPIATPSNMYFEGNLEVDNRSIYVGNVDYGATATEIENHFIDCGVINRVTILCNRYDGHPKGFAYIEFEEQESVQTAIAMDKSIFSERPIKVMPKRTNRPGLSTTNRPPRGMYCRGGGQGSIPRGSYYSGFRPTRRPRSYRRVAYAPY